MLTRLHRVLLRPKPALPAPGTQSAEGSERGMAVNRLFAGLLVLVFVAIAHPDAGLPTSHSYIGVSAYLALGLALLLHIQLWPKSSVWRRITAMAVDAGAVSFELYAGGAISALLYPGYLWIIVGNGFRFGVRSIVAASALCLTGFGIVVATTPYWRTQPSLVAGLITGLVILPAYASSLISRLQAARQQAEEASRAKTLFLASVSHELRTPLNAIVGMGDLLRGTALDAEQAPMVSTIETAAETLLALIGDLLDVSRADAGRLETRRSDFDLARLLAEVTAMIMPQARAKGLLVNTFITTRTSTALHGDARHLREILLNLCSNAVKFTQHGSVTIAADGEPDENGTTHLRLEVVDTGIGIAPEAQDKIFDVFTQADETVMDRYGGTGLGLALVDRLVRLMGGKVGVRSIPGQGSTFWVYLDMDPAGEIGAEPPPSVPIPVIVASMEPDRAASLAEAVTRLGANVTMAQGISALAGARPSIMLLDHAAAALPELADGHVLVRVRSILDAGLPPLALRERFATAIQYPGSDAELANALHIAAAYLPPAMQGPALPAEPVPAYAPLRVLVADDNRVNQTVTLRMLERAGHSVILAGNGEQALEILLDESVDIVLMDVNMPVLNGIETAQTYQFAPLSGRRIPMIGLTADASADTKARCFAAGMSACLVKPVRAPDLLQAIQELAAPFVASETDDPVVTAIAAHPRFRVVPPAAVDAQALADLTALGGADFVAQVIGEFVTDAEAIIVQLEQAAANRDVHRFRAEAHAMCSSAANVGASALRSTCEPWQYLSSAELEDAGPDLVDRLRHVWRRTRTDLQAAVDPQDNHSAYSGS